MKKLLLSTTLFVSMTTWAQGLDIIDYEPELIEELVWQSEICLLDNKLYFAGDEAEHQGETLTCVANRSSYNYHWQ